ncbi:MAG: BamA/TamA family outer membrane protein [Cyclobacteriaceae bacterium]
MSTPKITVLFILLVILLQACTGTRHLQDAEYLLRRQKIKGNDEISKSELEVFYRQKANKKFPLIPVAPYVMIYYFGKRRYDPAKVEKRIEKAEIKFDEKIAKAKAKKKPTTNIEGRKRTKLEKLKKVKEEGNMFMRWGEPVAVYDPQLAEQTRSQMELYLKTKGFFEANAKYNVDYRGKSAYIEYLVSEGDPLIIDTVWIDSPDTLVLDILQNHDSKSFLKAGQRYNQDDFASERERIDVLLKNYGYYDFTRQYVSFAVDTLDGDDKAKVKTSITLPPRQTEHRLFVIDSVNFVTDVGVSGATSTNRVINPYRGITYQYFEDDYSRKILNNRVFIRTGEQYSLENTRQTQLQLANLDNFKFINVNYDTTGGAFIANIFTSPLNKYQTTNELGMNVREGFPGPFYNLALKSRNVFKGLENADINIYFGFEGVGAASRATDVYRSIEAGGKLTFTFPQFLMPSSYYFKRKIGKYDPKTRLQVGYNLTKRPEFERTSFNTSIVYAWNKSQKINYNFTLTELSIVNSNILQQQFLEFLQAEFQRGNNLLLAFNPSFVTSIGFLTTINFRLPTENDQRASILRLQAESGGTIFNLLRPTAIEQRNLEYFKFVKLSANYRRHMPVTRTGIVASRINIGIGLPYGDNGLIPYEKAFFIGGSSSVRAWRPRRLGLGSFNQAIFNEDETYDPELLDNKNKPEQLGDILIEANIEYRDKLVGFVDWAFFIDAGNVWKATRIYDAGENFDFNRFYKEIAVGSGLGIRLNFSFLIIRLDAGVKVYDPERPEGDRFVGRFVNFKNLLGKPGQTIWNIAIGYPF